ncbi:MAG: aminopeptidase [Bacteroidia bacterium]
MRFRKLLLVLADVLLLPALLFALFNVSLLVYGVKMGKGQLDIVYGARPISEVLADNQVADSVKVKLRLILEIREFAFDKLGLKRNDNYSAFYDQKGKPAIYVVSGCEKFSLTPYRWSYSVLGKMPYKGFFEKAPAETEKQRLIAEGYDADLGGAAGWSTLGWFPDPVLSQMLNYSEGDLAELIIHELTHGTIFVTDNVEYNENLANFIGIKGAIEFLKLKYGNDSPQLKSYLNGMIADRNRELFMLSAAKQLDSLFKSFPAKKDTATCLAKRNEVYAKIVEQARTQKIGDSLYPVRLKKRLDANGNTVLMHALRYGEKQDDFENEFLRYKSVSAYVSYLRSRFGID